MRTKMAQPRLFIIPALCLIASLPIVARAQRTRSEPVTDSSVQASPIKPAPSAAAVDSSSQASPITSQHTGSGIHLAPHTALDLRLSSSIDSGRLKNGQTVHATLAQPVALSPRGSLPAGTPVDLTVVETLPAGRIYAAGEFSLQVLRLGSVPVYTDTLTFRGQPGHKDLPDSAPAVGTDAGLAAGAALTFRILPPPSAAVNPAPGGKSGPGAVNGVASGNPPPPGSSSAAQKHGPAANGGHAKQGAHARTVQPADNTPGPAQNLDKSSVAPNQPASPQNATPTDSTQPR